MALHLSLGKAHTKEIYVWAGAIFFFSSCRKAGYSTALKTGRHESWRDGQDQDICPNFAGERPNGLE